MKNKIITTVLTKDQSPEEFLEEIKEYLKDDIEDGWVKVTLEE